MIDEEIMKNINNPDFVALSNTRILLELETLKADVINIADGRQSIKVKSVRNIIDRRIKELNNERNVN